jgi:hypothetical protein
VLFFSLLLLVFLGQFLIELLSPSEK